MFAEKFDQPRARMLGRNVANVTISLMDLAIQRLYDAVNNPASWEAAIDISVEATGAVSGIIAVRDLGVLGGLSGEPYDLNVMSAML